MRSWLYVPDIRNVGSSEADALIVDLERAGEPAGVRSWIDAVARPAVWVRLPVGEPGRHAVRAVVSPALAGICVAAESANELAALGTVIAEAEEAVGLPVGRIAVVPRLETAAAVLQAAEIARAPRVARLQLAEGQLVRQLRVEPGEDERELLWARSMVVIAGAAAGIAPPIAASCPAGTECEPSAQVLRRLGFRGRTCLDDEQVRIANKVFANASTLA
ncbi:aldolase/citrate lyase family protein [Dactylosporangium sp. NBC_01737]|uniref:aldolase/citrate lyase family protein n=1 Tax=Dactylosporangium sp. NBC_01737 TaxID=2975959 RepID=UPI002E14B90B|nr:aldolase/citrate lyase family protein [Dactylosporangium sp. NBC_01737]